MKRKAAVLLGALTLSVLMHSTLVHSEDTMLPKSIMLYEAQKYRLPRSNFNLSLCRLIERSLKQTSAGFVNSAEPFWALPADVLTHERGETCNLKHVTLAYGGWCAAGIQDAKGPHFSQSLMPRITVKQYETGETVVWVNNYLKSDTVPSKEDEDAAVVYLEGDPLPEWKDIRGGEMPLFPPTWERDLPLRKGFVK